jgi:parallel beta-helix repeat protein
VIDVYLARNASVVGNRITGNVASGIAFGNCVNTTIAKNHIVGSPKTDAEGIVVGNARNTTVGNNDVRSYPRGVLVEESTGTRVLSNDITDSTVLATGLVESPGTKILSNDISRSGESGIVIFGPERANNDAKVLGNNISGGAWGMYVANSKGGFIAANTIHDNCAGMFFEANGFQKGPVSGFEVKANTVENNTHSCRAAQFGRNFSGIGIVLHGAREMEVTGNQISGNVPTGPTRISGGVVVAVNPYRKGDPKPMNNSVIGNHFGRNKPDIFYDGSGSGNRFRANNCNSPR